MNGGYGQDSYWQADGDWGYDDDDDEEDVPSATTQDISEAYAAGWRAKAQASGNKQSRGYRSKGSGKARVRGPERRQVDDRKKRSVCSSCGNQGHWRGDPECPKVVAGEDSLHPRHQGAGGVSEVNVTFKSGPPSSPTSPSFSSPRNPGHKEPTSPTSSSLPVKAEEPPAKVTKTEPKPAKVTRVNWTMMVGNDHSPWELLQDYDSDEGDNSMASISDDEEPPALPPTSNASGSDKPPSKAEYKLALKTVLKALDYDDEEVERHSKKKKPGKEVKLRPGELLQALPHMDKAEKRELYKALKAEQETIAEETVQQAPPTSDKLKRANQRAGGYRATASSSSAPAAPTAAAPQEPQKDVPAAVRKKQLATFRRTLFENSLSRRGHVKPSQASEYPTAEQEACPHSFDDLRWGANNSAHWAHCKRCKLKRVLYYSMDHGAMMVGEDLQEVYNMGPSLSPGEVIVDTGCRTSVAGCAWHKMHQAAIRRLGLQFFEVGQEETFRFGAGPPILSRKAYLYPCFTHGQPTWLRISEVDGAAASCPGLVGPSEMARWSVELRFSDRTMVVFGEQRPMCLSVTRHPVLQLLEIQPHQADPSLWGTPDLQQQKHILKENPHQMAFLEGGSPDGHQSDPEESDHPDASEVPPETQEEETWDLTPANVGPEQLALMQEKLEYETSVTEVLMKDAFVASAAAPEDPYDSEGSISGGISETSHELGAPAETDSGSSTDEEVEVPRADPSTDHVHKKLRVAYVFALASMFQGQDAPQNEWLSKYEVAMLKSLTGLEVTSARLHRAPRKRMQVPTKARNRARTSVLIGQDPSVTLVVEENAQEVTMHPKKKAPFLWTGLTIFHREKTHKSHRVYVELPGGLIEAKMHPEEAAEFHTLWCEEIRDLLVADALVLRLKENKKELDPKFFNSEEQKAFERADQKEWSQWLANKVVRFLQPDEAARVPRSKIFRAPMRIVRVNKAAEKLAPLVAKSRLIIPGHLDPEIGTYRTDSPTAATMTTRLIKLLAASRGYQIYSFDVSTSFLSGKATEREIYVRAPTTGRPRVGEHRAIRPLELMQVLKSAYGLTESPRLWYLEAKDGMDEVELKELAASRSVFLASDKGKTWAICALHVDDGLLVGDDKDERFVKLREKINQRFNIKEWQFLEEDKPLNFLGVELHKEKDGFTDRMDKYVQGIEPPDAPKGKPETPLSPEQVTTLRRLVMKMRWPAQHTMPEILYLVSRLAQSINHGTIATFNEAIKVLNLMKEEVHRGHGRLWYRHIPEKELAVFTFFDASLGKEEQGRSQLGSIHFVGSAKASQGPAPASVVDFTTNKSTRVVRSSMSAEALSLCTAADRHLYLRLILQMLLTGVQEIAPTWRQHLKIPGSVITDAKSLFDHLVTTGQIPTERQTLLDLLVCKDLVENNVVLMRWVPTYRQFADFLTKMMAPVLWAEFMRSGRISMKETAEEAKEEERRRGLRKAQRQRRKDRMKGLEANSPAASGKSILAASSRSRLPMRNF